MNCSAACLASRHLFSEDNRGLASDMNFEDLVPQLPDVSRVTTCLNLLSGSPKGRGFENKGRTSSKVYFMRYLLFINRYKIKGDSERSLCVVRLELAALDTSSSDEPISTTDSQPVNN